MQTEEPIEAVEFRAKSADESIKEFQEKIAEYENVKRIAQEKLQRMRESGAANIITKDQKIDELASRIEYDEDKTRNIKDTLSQAQQIESKRRTDVELSEVAKHMNKPAAPTAMFDSEPIIPSQQRKLE